MLIHKEIIIKVVFSFIFMAVTFIVLGPVFFNFLKKKLPGYNDHENNIDIMIRRQKERLRSQYGLQGDLETSQMAKKTLDATDVKVPQAPAVQKIYQETHWGGGEFLKEIQQEISKNFSYTLADSKVNAFILLSEKKNYLRFLTPEHLSSKIALKNYLVTLLIFFLLVEEIREKNFFILEKIASKLGIPAQQLALAFQIKILMFVNLKQDKLKDERIFSEALVLNQYSEDTIKEATENIAKKEANLWAKSTSLLYEELTLTLNYASILSPLPKLKNRKDIETACTILGIDLKNSADEIKKTYKKIALLKHPDKITSQKLPSVLERKAIERFNQIQEAYEVIIAHKK
jgi:DnaJ-domain-containing protein 1